MQKALKDKLATVVELVNNTMTEPDLMIEYCIPGVESTAESCSTKSDPYIVVKYAEDKFVERKIPLNDMYLMKEPEDIANFVTFNIEQFLEEIDSVQYGAQ
jgi:hypothetical protein